MSSLTLPPAARQSGVHIEEVVDEKAAPRSPTTQQPATEQPADVQQQNEALQKKLDELIQNYQGEVKKCSDLDTKRQSLKDNLSAVSEELLVAERKRLQSFAELSDFRLSVVNGNVRYLQQQLSLKEGK